MKTNFHWSVIAFSLCLVLAGVMGQGCKSGKEEPLVTTTDPILEAEPDGGDRGLPELDLAALLFDKDKGLKPVYFDFDSSALRTDALATLDANAKRIKEVPNVIIQIAGHCDERGTQEYNLALGERRALGIRSHLIKLGISGDRMVTISCGEEFPANTGHTEAAWSQNRRAEFSKAQKR